MTIAAPTAATQALAPPPVPSGKPAPPTEFPPAVKQTVEWLNSRFAWWYHHNPPPMPDRFTRREFGFILWPERPGTPPFIRHRGYDEAGRLHEELARRGPHSVYYSTAYYRRPGEPKMLDKQWLGAELIFDLDADHLAKVEAATARFKEGKGPEMPLAEQLRLVKEQFKRLVDEFLLGDFGLSEKDVWITFSGGRGYHAHVMEPRLLQLDSKGRREVVDYITGKFPADREGNPDLSGLFSREVVDADMFKKHVSKVEKVRFPTPDAPGWGGRLSREVVRMLREHVVNQPQADAIRWLRQLPGIGPTKAADAAKFLTEDKLDRFVNGRLEGGVWRGKGELASSAGAGNTVVRIFEMALAQWSLPMAKGETDEPVTADIKRLIRLPGSLHGKSGLEVVTLTRSDLDGFEPLRDAVAFGRNPVRIKARKDAEVTLGGETVRVKGGEECEIPESHAVFLLARQGGTIVGG